VQCYRTYGTLAQNGTRELSLACDIHCCPNTFYFFCWTSVSMLWRIYIYIHTYIHTHLSECVETVYELPLLPSNTANKTFKKTERSAKCWLDIYYWGAGLAVTGHIHDIGQNVLQSPCQTGSSSSPSYCHIFFLIAFHEEAFIINVIIMLCINFTM